MKTPDAPLQGPEQQTSVRLAVNVAAAGVTLTCVLWALQAYQWFDLTFFPEQLLAVVLGLSVFAAFLQFRVGRDHGGNVPWYDWLCALAGLTALLWIALSYERLLFNVGQGSNEAFVLGLVSVLLLLEVLRRATGYVLFGVVVLFVIYTFV
jgi:TRAP-type uncharacterized transport system fused permease subunit